MMESFYPLIPFTLYRGNYGGLYGLLFRYFWPQDSFWKMVDIQGRHFIYPNLTELGPLVYQGYNDEIRRLVPKERLLELNVKEGWEPLCKFLGKEVPAKSFPRTNERALIRQNVEFVKAGVVAQVHRKMWKLGAVVFGLTAVCAGVIYQRIL
jgi:hypothetical protein